MTLNQYIENINKRYQLGNATEHTFRGDLQQLLESLVPTISATNEPKRQKCGAPDYILTKKDIPVGFIEAKNIGDTDLDGVKKTENKEQFDRYKGSLNNLIFTDYINFHLYRDGQFVTKIAIATLRQDQGNNNFEIIPLPENFSSFENLIKDFCTHIGQTIKSPKRLAEMMAGKARLLSEIIEKSLKSDHLHQEDSTLKDQMIAFKEILIHDITPKGFADVYAQTIAYGMFAARLHDPSLDSFSRQEAAELIPKSNPFLRKLFGYIAGPDIDDRIKWIVDSLAEIFLACNVEQILKNYGKQFSSSSGGGKEGADPIIHFYETFLSEYDPKLRKARGVWYTPQPVVNFIVRAVDDILKTEFDLPQGLADTSKTKIKVNVQTNKGLQPLAEQEVHKVQILDPATGTGTFLAEVVKHIHKKFEGQQGIWSNYVNTHLLPRLNGFELLMASYAMAHLKLDLLLTETGYNPTPSNSPLLGGAGGGSQRLKVYLTNSLEEHHQDTGTLFANWLSQEANEANHIKRDTPVMCVIGNPPYSGESANKGEWIMKLMEDYKKEPGGKEKLKEQNSKFINDDYVKFLRYGQHFIEKNGSGVLAFINPHGFLDNPTFRGMRWNLLKTYDKIYTIDLHGNAKKKETAPDGSADVNVFDIEQGVSINFFIKTGKKKTNELGKVFHFDVFGKRDFKYDFLSENNLKSIHFQELENIDPHYFFNPKDFKDISQYEKGFTIDKLFEINSLGIQTHRDQFIIDVSKPELEKRILDALDHNNLRESILSKYKLKESTDFQLHKVRQSNFDSTKLVKIDYRLFDIRNIYYDKDFIDRDRRKVMKHLTQKNISLVISKHLSTFDFQHIFISKHISESCLISIQTKEQGYCFPLYLYPESTGQQSITALGAISSTRGHDPLSNTNALHNTNNRTPNLNPAIVKQLADKLGLPFVPEKSSPPLEGCPQGGVVNNTTNKVVNNTTNKVVNNTTNKVVNITPNKVILTTINNTPIIRNFVENLPHNPSLNELAKEKRKEGILSEVLFWQQVHKGNFHKIDFDRQRIIGNYIVDFYVKTLGLIVEIDGNSHDEKGEYDVERQNYLESFGLKVFRCTDIDVKKNINAVFESLENFIINEYGESTTPPFGHPSTGGEFAPIDILDYIYAVLHSPTYREKYKEFLKIDFPRVPYPKDKKTFWQLVQLGGEIRKIHLLESPVVENYITQYPVDGDNVVTKPSFICYQEECHPELVEGSNEEMLHSVQHDKMGKVYINDTQYFDKVPQAAWEFYIGGYQPAQKWLKDRKGRALDFEDILHYQKIIVALFETDRLMKEIDKIEIE